MNNAEHVFDILKDEYELNDDNVAEFRWAMSFGKEYAEYVQLQAQIAMASIQMGQSVLSLGEIMKPLFNATHKLVAGDERDLPGKHYFELAAKASSEALEHLTAIATMTEDYATAMLSCDDTIDVSYM